MAKASFSLMSKRNEKSKNEDEEKKVDPNEENKNF